MPMTWIRRVTRRVCHDLAIPQVCGTRGIDILAPGSLPFQQRRRRAVEGVADDCTHSRRSSPNDLLKGSVKKSYAPGRRHRLGCAAGSRQVLPAARKRVAVRHTAMGLDDARATDRAVPPGVGEHAVGGHLVREHPQPGAAAQDDAPGPDRQCHALRADRTRRRDPPHGDVRQGDRTGRRQAGAAPAITSGSSSTCCRSRSRGRCCGSPR